MTSILSFSILIPGLDAAFLQPAIAQTYPCANPTKVGKDGNDVVYGGLGADTLFAGAGTDTIDSRDGVKNNDFFHGGYADSDTCFSDPDTTREC